MKNLEKKANEKIIAEYKEVKDLEYTNLIFETINSIGLILNEKREIVYFNSSVLKFLNLDSLSILGQKPGEVFGCIYSNESPLGCGAGETCRYCKAIQTVLKSTSERKKVKNELTLTIEKNAIEMRLELELTANPLEKNGKKYTIVIIEDVSNKKRKESLEQIFFHDILNIASNISSLTEYLLSNSESLEIEELLPLVHTSSKELLDQIHYQKKIIEAENGDLDLIKENINAVEIIEILIKRYKKQKRYKKYEINFNFRNKELTLNSDKVLFYRIIENLFKNSLEASKNFIVDINLYEEKEDLIISIKNDEILTEEVKTKIFQRFYSTKGKGRGLGTYSAKLLSESISAKLYFESMEGLGTVFYFKIKKS